MNGATAEARLDDAIAMLTARADNTSVDSAALGSVLEAAWSEVEQLADSAEWGRATSLASKVEALLSIVGHEPSVRQARVALARFAFADGETDAAIAWSRSIIALVAEDTEPEAVDLRIDLLHKTALAQAADGQRAAAVRTYVQLHEDATRNDRTTYAFASAFSLSHAYLIDGRLDLSAHSLDQARHLLPFLGSDLDGSTAASSVAGMCGELSRRLFYDRQDASAALTWAGRALGLAPVNEDGLRIRGFALMQLQRIPEAVEAFRAWAGAEPTNGTALSNLASALAAGGDLSAAALACAEAVRLEPDNLVLRISLATLLERAGKTDTARSAIDEAIRVGVNLEQRQEGQPTGGLRIELGSGVRTMQASLEDEVDFALLFRAKLDLEHGRCEAIEAVLDALSRRRDPIVQAWGDYRRGQWLHRAGDVEGAIAAYRRALATGSATTEVLTDLASLLLTLDRDSEALDVLTELADRRQSPEEAIEGLTLLLDRHPGRGDILHVRGIAHFEAFHAQAARADLRAALDAGITNPRTHYRLALSNLLGRPEDRDARLDIGAAITSLAQAITRARAGEEDVTKDATRALRWLVDRVLAEREWLIFQALLAEKGESEAWHEHLPGLSQALRAVGAAIRVQEARDWSAAVRTWTEAQALFEAANLPVSAARMSAHVADALLRVYDIENATAHLARAHTAVHLIGRPLTEGLGEGEPEGSIHFEIDYFGVYGVGLTAYLTYLRTLDIQLADRSGDTAGALSTYGDGVWLFAEAKVAASSGADELTPVTRESTGTAVLAAGVGESTITAMAQMLRDAGRWEEAGRLLDRFVGDAPDDRISAEVWATRSTLAITDLERSLAFLNRAATLTHDPRKRTVIDCMRAQALVRNNRYDDALTILDQVDAAAAVHPTFVAVIRAEAELGAGNPESALRVMEPIVDGLEQDRAGLTRWSLRESWSTPVAHPYEIAIRAAVACGRNALAFEWAERSRARGFLDDLYDDEPAVVELTRRARSASADAAWLEELPDELHDSEMRRLQSIWVAHADVSPEYANDSHLRADDRPEPDWRRLRRAVARKSARLNDELNTARVAALTRHGQAPVTWMELRNALGPVLVAHYYSTSSGVLLFIGTRDEPDVVEVDVDLDEIEAVLAVGRSPDGGFDLRRVDLARLQILAGPLVAEIATRSKPDELICIVPHGRIHLVPLHVLKVAGDPLSIRNPVSLWPSASILVRRLGEAVDEAPTGRAVVLGDPGDDLAYARIEAAAVADQLRVTPQLGPTVKKDLLLRALLDPTKPPSVVHIASHGMVTTDGAGAGIVLAAGSESNREPSLEVLTAQDLIGISLPASLVVLSCCDSGRGGLRPGDELTGLVRAFLGAGAAAVVPSQWSVDDLSTSLLMREFYAEQVVDNREVSLAVALQAAARTIRSMTRAEVTEAVRDQLEFAVIEPRARQVLARDSALSAASDDYSRVRARLVASGDRSLRDAALQADEQRALRGQKSSDRPFAHPHFWAPFVLMGDWRAGHRRRGPRSDRASST